MTTVLIVDDEALAIQAIRRSINWKNLDVDRVLDAANGVEAQKILRQEPVQVLVCDLEMPRMSGIELLEWMKTSCPDTEAVILTCHESFPMAQKAMELGCVEYVLKPIAPAELTASIRHALNLWKTQESMRGTRRAYENGRSLRRDQYLQDVLEKNILSTAESLFNCAQKYDLELDVSAPLQVVRVLVQMPAALPQSPEEARIRHWKTLLLQEDAQTVQAEITTELNRLSLKAAQERMQWIAQTLIQALHCTLQERGCPEATELVEAKPVFESLPQFLSWVQGNLARTERLLRHSPGEEQVIRRIKEYIELNIHQELTRENIAAAVYLNPDYTARLFKRKTGQSLNDYIQNKRINLARQLLAGTDMPVGDLAVALGYSSFSHFTKLFKSIEGVTPSDYRKQHARMPG